MLITVLMPVYNGERYLHEAIVSILNQTFKDFEFLIINDGSTDSSEEIILSYSDSRIKYLRNEINLKLIDTLNKGLELARGKYIVRMDADDISLPDRLSKQVHYMENNPGVDLLGSWYELVENEKVVGKVMYKPNHDLIKCQQLYQINVSHGTCIIRKESIIKYQLKFDRDFLHAEDYEFFTRASEFLKLGNIQRVLYRVRVHENKVSKLYRDIQLENTRKVQLRELNKLGVCLNENEYTSFIYFCYHDWNFFNDIKAVQYLLPIIEKLVVANTKTKYIAPKEFNKYILYKWFHLNYNCGNERLLYDLSIASQLRFHMKFKFKMKTLIK